MSKLNKLQQFSNQVDNLITKIEKLKKVNRVLVADGEQELVIKVNEIKLDKFLSPTVKIELVDRIHSISQIQIEEYESELEELLGKIKFKN